MPRARRAPPAAPGSSPPPGCTGSPPRACAAPATRRACGIEPGARVPASSQQLPEIEVVALQARVEGLAVAAEIDLVELLAEAAHVGRRARRIEEREHRAIELEALAGEVVAVRIVVDHHDGPGATDEVPARERREPSRDDRVHRLARSVDAAEPGVLARHAAALLPRLHRSERHEVVARPHEARLGMAREKPL